MNRESMEPYGKALMDFFNKDASEDLIIHRDDGLNEVIPISSFFKEPPDFSPVEQTALNLCRGRVLDVGAGVGSHSIALQDRGLVVCAIDIVPQACEIMRKRGVIDVRCDGRYFGEIRLQFEYKGQRGSPYGWLHVDSKTLAAHAVKAGWLCKVICQEESGDYLAQLVH